MARVRGDRCCQILNRGKHAVARLAIDIADADAKHAEGVDS